MKKITPSQNPALSSTGSDNVCKQQAASLNSVNVIQEIIVLSVSSLNSALRALDNKLHADIVLDVLIENIAGLTGRRLIDDCSLVNGTATNCKFSTKVVEEMEGMMSATEKCIRIIDGCLADKNHVYGLTASRELLDAINAASFLLIMSAPDTCDAITEKITNPPR
jgi:hypothetical protein